MDASMFAHSCPILCNPMDCRVHGVTKSWIWLSNFHFHWCPMANQRRKSEKESGWSSRERNHKRVDLSVFAIWLILLLPESRQFDSVLRAMLRSNVSGSLRPYGLYLLQSTRLLCPWDFPSRNTGVGCHFLLHGIFPIQGWNQCLLCLLHLRWILYCWVIREAPDWISLTCKSIAQPLPWSSLGGTWAALGLYDFTMALHLERMTNSQIQSP